MTTILAMSGSLRASSTNTAILRAMAKLAPAAVTVAIYDGLATLPHFSPELDTECAHGMPGSLKNAFDWLVSSGEFSGKQVAALSASPNHTGGAQANAWLRQTLLALNATIVEEASLLIPLVKTKLDASGNITDLETKRALQQVVAGVL